MRIWRDLVKELNRYGTEAAIIILVLCILLLLVPPVTQWIELLEEIRHCR